MHWYVKYEDGTINGPMSQVDAEIKRDGVDDACTFSEQIFKPQFATFEEVEICLRDLRALVGDENDDEDDCGLGEICQQAINVITLLCGKARKVELEMTVDIASLLLELAGHVEHHKSCTESACHDDCKIGREDMCRRAAETIVFLSAKTQPSNTEVKEAVEWLLAAEKPFDESFCAMEEKIAALLVSLSAKKVVCGTIESGMLDISEVSPGVEVFINDYDIQEVDEDRTSEDKDGRRCVVLKFGS